MRNKTLIRYCLHSSTSYNFTETGRQNITLVLSRPAFIAINAVQIQTRKKYEAVEMRKGFKFKTFII